MMHRVFAIVVSSGLIVFAFLYTIYFRASANFPVDTLLTIEIGTPLAKVAADLKERQLVRSAFWLRIAVSLRRGEAGALAGDYFFKSPASLLRIAERLATGEYGLPTARIVIPEGLSNRETALLLANHLPKFNIRDFLALAAEKEGYLFPDSYQFFTNATAAKVIVAMEDNFKKKAAELTPFFSGFGKPEREVVIMASLLEKEARTTDTRRHIAGILWKRLRLGMPLQVDAVFPYIFEGKAYDLTDGDLNVDSPYNTYRYKGFPPTAIANPGLDALRAALTPIDTPYFYYLSDKEGEMHYAKTHDEHLRNRARYLNL